MQKHLLTHALALGVGILLALGVQTAGALRASTPEAEAARVDQLYEEYRQLWFDLGTDFRPAGYRLLGKPPRLGDSSTRSAPRDWYRPEGPHSDWLILPGDLWRTTQRTLEWAHDNGAAIVVEILFTTHNQGRGPLAMLGGDPTVFRPDWHFLGARDNLIFSFQLLPLDRTWAGRGYPPEWGMLIEPFIGAVRTFLDDRDRRR
ncbi:MAG: hypothetical protein AB1492_05990 [Bacillota bacterium]